MTFFQPKYALLNMSGHGCVIFQKNGIRRIEHVVLTHQDNDHAGGIDQLNAQIHLEYLWSNAHALSLFDHAGKKSVCEQGEAFDVGEVAVTFLWPQVGPLQNTANDRSCVVLEEFSQFNVLMMGDVSKQVERKMLQMPDFPQNVDFPTFWKI